MVANVTNTIGLVPGGLSGVAGYRRELEGQGDRLRRLGAASLLGGLVGAILLFELPASVFAHVVPILILVACVLVIVQPRLRRILSARPEKPGSAERRGRPGYALLVGAWATGVYGGYFGAAQGVILISLLAIFLDDHLQRLNATKNVLTVLVNAIAAVLFAIFAPVAWGAALVLAAGSIVGGFIGARAGRRLPPTLLRGVIVVIGLVAAVKLLT